MNEADAAIIDGHETVVLSALMNGADDLPVTADNFGSSPTSPNRIIYNCLRSLENRCFIAVTDALRLNGELDKVGGAGRITEIATMLHDKDNLKYALDQVLEHSQARQVAKIGERMHKGEIGHGEALEQLECLNRHARSPHIDIGRQGSAVKLADVEPWPEPVEGTEILNAIAKRFDHYAVLPDGAGDTQALWCAHTHMFKRFPISPRLHISAPTEECGKTTVRNCVSLFCARAKRTENMTTAVMFRLVSGHSPTILADECDKWLFTNEELVGLVQSGHGKGGTITRCEGDSNELREFGCYAPFALAAIGKLPSQLHSRSICIRLERARGEEIKKRASFDFEHVEYETELNRKLARWISDNLERICLCDLKLPEHLFNRIADNWRPLFKIAQIAGGDWPQRCEAALFELTTGEDERENLRVMLLTDIREIFTGERIFSKDLVDVLVELKERPWPEIQKGKPITARWLARNLAVFGIHPGNIWDGENQAQAKGYERSQFDDAFDRYIPKTPALPVAQASNRPYARGNTENASVQKEIVWTDKKEPIREAYGRLDGSNTPNPAKGDKVI